MAQLMFPDIAGNAQQSFQQGQQTRANRLIGLAMGAQPDQRQAYLSQAGAIDPRTALAAGSLMDSQAAAQQAQQDAHLKRIRGAALYMASALKSGNPAQVEGAYQSVRPFLAEMGQAQGKTPPPQWDPNMEQALYHVIAETNFLDPSMSGSTPSQVQAFKYLTQGLSPADQEKARRVELGLDPRQSSAALKYMEVLGPDGRTRIVALDPRQVGGTVVDGGPMAQNPAGATGGGQGGMGMGAAVPGAPTLGAPNVGQPAPASTVEGAPPGTQVTQATGPDGARVQFAFAPGTADAVLAQAGAAAGLPQGGMSQPAPSGNAFTSPTEAQSAFNKAQATQAAETQAMRDRLPIEQQQAQQAQAVKTQQEARKARGSLIATTGQLDRLAKAAQDLMNDPGISMLAGWGSLTPVLPGTDRARAESELTTLKSQIGFGVLQNMREMSKTGGALGQISDKEEELLQNNLAGLSTKQSPEDFKRSLQKIIEYAQNSKGRLHQSYDTAYGSLDNGAQSDAQPSAPAQGGWAIRVKQ